MTERDGPAGADHAREDDRRIERESMADVSHTPENGDGAERVWDGTRVRPREGSTDE